MKPTITEAIPDASFFSFFVGGSSKGEYCASSKGEILKVESPMISCTSFKDPAGMSLESHLKRYTHTETQWAHYFTAGDLTESRYYGCGNDIVRCERAANAVKNSRLTFRLEGPIDALFEAITQLRVCAD
jgi:hypothetical protein